VSATEKREQGQGGGSHWRCLQCATLPCTTDFVKAPGTILFLDLLQPCESCIDCSFTVGTAAEFFDCSPATSLGPATKLATHDGNLRQVLQIIHWQCQIFRPRRIQIHPLSAAIQF